MTTKLKPCPFCGSTARSYPKTKDGDRIVLGAFVVCCGDYCKSKTGLFITEEAAIAAWNRRAGDDDTCSCSCHRDDSYCEECCGGPPR